MTVASFARKALKSRLAKFTFVAIIVGITNPWVLPKGLAIWRHGRAVRDIKASGGDIDYTKPLSKSWTTRVFGPEYLSPVSQVALFSVQDAQFSPLENLPELEHLFCVGEGLSDKGLIHLRGLVHLRSLSLEDTSITDAGLKCLENLTDLRTLYLGNTPVTGAGLRHFRSLKKLEKLDLELDHIDDAGIENVNEIAALVELGLSGTLITDEGLQRLDSLKNLKLLKAAGTAVTRNGVRKFLAVHPLCKVITSPWPDGRTESGSGTF